MRPDEVLFVDDNFDDIALAKQMGVCRTLLVGALDEQNMDWIEQKCARFLILR